MVSDVSLLWQLLSAIPCEMFWFLFDRSLATVGGSGCGLEWIQGFDLRMWFDYGRGKEDLIDSLEVEVVLVLLTRRYFFPTFADRNQHCELGEDLGENSARGENHCSSGEPTGRDCSVCKNYGTESGSQICTVHWMQM